MDFAKDLLKKQGWSQGKGLGKEESGISEAIKVAYKNDTVGVGFDQSEQFAFHWWDHIFNKAANSIVVKESDDGVVVSKDKNEQNLVISSKKPNKHSNKSLLYGRFVKASTSTQDSVDSESDSDDALDESVKKSDVEVYRICGGRTAHKGARHGLTCNGKLQRLEEQELGSLSNTPTGSRSCSPVNPLTLNIGQSQKEEEREEEEKDGIIMKEMKKQKKKKRKSKDFDNKTENDRERKNGDIETIDFTEQEEIRKKRKDENCLSTDTRKNCNGVESEHEDLLVHCSEKEKRKKRKRKETEKQTECSNRELVMWEGKDVQSTDVSKKEKKKKKRKEESCIEDVQNESGGEVVECTEDKDLELTNLPEKVKKKNKKKRKNEPYMDVVKTENNNEGIIRKYEYELSPLENEIVIAKKTKKSKKSENSVFTTAEIIENECDVSQLYEVDLPQEQTIKKKKKKIESRKKNKEAGIFESEATQQESKSSNFDRKRKRNKSDNEKNNSAVNGHELSEEMSAIEHIHSGATFHHQEKKKKKKKKSRD